MQKPNLEITSSDALCKRRCKYVSSYNVLNWFDIENKAYVQMARIDDAMEDFWSFVMQQCTDLQESESDSDPNELPSFPRAHIIIGIFEDLEILTYSSNIFGEILHLCHVHRAFMDPEGQKNSPSR